MKTVYLGLGSNVGDRRINLDRARALIESADLRVVRASSIYETEPREVRNQPWFLNMVVESETVLFPMQLLSAIHGIERELGRKRLTPKGPRTIDIDILLYANFAIRTGVLEIPHPRLIERRFVLEPLAEIAPDLRHPVSRKTVRELLAGVAGQIVKRVY